MLLATVLGAHPKLAPELESLSPSAKVDVIVRYKSGQPTRILSRLPILGGILSQTLDLVDSLLMTLTGEQIVTLASDPDVEYISPDRPIKAAMDYAHPTINANLARQAGYT
ncbi:MAG: hypothetical protein ACRD7E_25505, partial [Bryobacteraceae bacterium]